MKTLRPTDRIDFYTKFKPGDLIMVRNPRKLPAPLLEVEQVWLDHTPPPHMGHRLMYQVRDYDTRQMLHLVVEVTDRGYVRYEGAQGA